MDFEARNPEVGAVRAVHRLGVGGVVSECGVDPEVGGVGTPYRLGVRVVILSVPVGTEIDVLPPKRARRELAALLEEAEVLWITLELRPPREVGVGVREDRHPELHRLLDLTEVRDEDGGFEWIARCVGRDVAHRLDLALREPALELLVPTEDRGHLFGGGVDEGGRGNPCEFLLRLGEELAGEDLHSSFSVPFLAEEGSEAVVEAGLGEAGYGRPDLFSGHVDEASHAGVLLV